MISLIIDLIKELWLSSSYEDDAIVYSNDDEIVYDELD